MSVRETQSRFGALIIFVAILQLILIALSPTMLFALVVNQQQSATGFSIPGLEYLVQAGFAGLFVWLLFDTRREASSREAKWAEREAAYQKTIADFSKLLSEQGKLLEAMQRDMAQIAKTLERVQVKQNQQHGE